MPALILSLRYRHFGNLICFSTLHKLYSFVVPTTLRSHVVRTEVSPMESMHAAVVTSFEEPPHCSEFDVPTPLDGHHELLNVLAVGLHPRVRTDAAGRHYSSTGALPMVPGIDGVGRLASGSVVYFVTDDRYPGSMAEKAVVDVRRTVALPHGIDTLRVAAAMNPAMSSWVALRRRVPLEFGQSVLVLGATGNAGTMAVQIAKRLGAGLVVGAGRDALRLAALTRIGADRTVQLTDSAEDTASALAIAAADVDVVIDYLWGEPAQRAMMALLMARTDRSQALNWIQIGAVAGPTMDLASVALRSANVRIQGNGQGAVSTSVYLAELPSLIDEINSGSLAITPRSVPLRDVESAWSHPDAPGERTVLIP
jgi:NADPH:quinone reductase-like Zn-dependent oxidoreductase